MPYAPDQESGTYNPSSAQSFQGCCVALNRLIRPIKPFIDQVCCPGEHLGRSRCLPLSSDLIDHKHPLRPPPLAAHATILHVPEISNRLRRIRSSKTSFILSQQKWQSAEAPTFSEDSYSHLTPFLLFCSGGGLTRRGLRLSTASLRTVSY